MHHAPCARLFSPLRRSPSAAGFLPSICIAVLLHSGCASTRHAPRDFDLQTATFVQPPTEPPIDINGLPGKLAGSGVGAATGAGAGAAIGSTACLLSGPLFFVCLVAVLPATTAVGAVGGATTGAVRTESSDALDAKKALLARELARISYQQRFIERLRDSARSGYAIELPFDGRTPASMTTQAGSADGARLAQAALEPRWIVEVGLSGVSTDGKDTFALALEGRIVLRRRGSERVFYEHTFDIVSEASHTTAEFAANDSALVSQTLDETMTVLAKEMALDIRRMAPGTGVATSR